jgi:hypothetical protein
LFCHRRCTLNRSARRTVRSHACHMPCTPCSGVRFPRKHHCGPYLAPGLSASLPLLHRAQEHLACMRMPRAKPRRATASLARVAGRRGVGLRGKKARRRRVLCLVRPTTSCSPALHRFAHTCAAPCRVGRHWSPQGELHPASFPSMSELPYSTSNFHQSSSDRHTVYTADHLARDRAMAAVDPRRH